MSQDTQDQVVPIDEATRRAIIAAQRIEATEAAIYEKLAGSIREEHNRSVLRQIAADERGHAEFWKRYTNEDVGPNRLRVWFYFIVAKVLGLTFGIKRMERGEETAQQIYGKIATVVPGADRIIHDEDRHEHQLIAMIDEEKLKYVGSIVLGLNDALVELTGALAGFTMAFHGAGNTRLVATAGFVTGVAASLSMAASEYLSTKTEEGENPLKSAVYTGIAYVFTVCFLIMPYFLFDNAYVCLGMSVLSAIIVIALFTYYVSVAQDINFRERFTEMAGISLTVALVTFAIGWLIRTTLGIEV